MIIQKLEIISFGKFKNKSVDFSDGLNIIYGDNESGKSTLVSFIYAMLYGFGDNRGKTLSIREKFTPWSGGVCEGKITVKTDDGENITIYRKAGNAKKYDTLRIYNTSTGEELSITPEEIVGVNSDTFFKTLCIKQLSTVFDGNNDEITQRLSNIASTGDESASYEKAQKLLEGIRREIQPQRGKGGELADIINKITIVEKNKSTQQNISSELKATDSLLATLEKEYEELKINYEEFLKRDYNASIGHLLGRIEEIKKHSSDKKLFILPLLIGVVLSVLSVIITIWKGNYLYIPFAIGIIFIIYGLIKKKPTEDTNITALEQELEKLRAEKADCEKKLYIIKERFLSSEERLSRLRIRRETLRLSITNEEYNSHTLYEKKKVLETQLKTVTLASEALKRAHEKMQKNFTPVLNKIASQYFNTISGGKYTRIFCGEQFGSKIDSDIPRESDFFSGGTIDQLYLSVRLSLIDMLFKEKSCSLILDQPFLQYDDTRKNNTLELLENLQNNRQILLFTSDKNVNSSNKQTEILT